ncbi:MAG: translocation/assembly module TamB domain-containing protein [Gammaproteobacteria bacterium]
MAFAQTPSLMVRIDGLRWPELGKLFADRIEIRIHNAVSHQTQTLLQVEQFLFQWRPAALQQRVVHITALRAETVSYTLPATQAQDAQAKKTVKSGFDLSSFPQIQLDELIIRTLNVLHENAQHPVPPLSVAGKAVFFDRAVPVDATLNIDALNENPTSLFVMAHALSPRAIHVTGRVQEPDGGWLGQRLKLPVKQDLKAEFDAEIKKNVAKNADRLKVRVNTFLMPLFTHTIEVSGAAELDLATQALTVQTVRIKTDERVQQANAYVSSTAVRFEAQLDELPLTLMTPWVKEIKSGVVSGAVHGEWLPKQKADSPTVKAHIETAMRYASHEVKATVAGEYANRLLRLAPSQLRLDGSQVDVQGVLDLYGKANNLLVHLDTLHTDALRNAPELKQVPIPESLHGQIDDSTIRWKGAIRDPHVYVSTSAQGTYQGQFFEVETELDATRRNANIKALVAKVNAARFEGIGKVDWTGDQNDFRVHFLNATQKLLALAPQVMQDRVPPAWHFMGEGAVTLSGSLSAPRVATDATVTGRYTVDEGAVPFRLRTKHSVQLGNRDAVSLTIDQLALQVFNRPVFQASGSYMDEQFDLAFNLKRLPTRALTMLGLEHISGEAVAELRVTGSSLSPLIQGHVQYGNTFLNGYQGKAPFKVVSRFKTDQGLFSVNAHFTQNGNDLGQSDIRFPLDKTMAFFLNKPADVQAYPLDVYVKMRTDLKILGLFIDPRIHRVEGQCDSELLLGGTIRDPEITGHVRVEDGRYANDISGIDLSHLRVDVAADKQKVTLNSLRATTLQDGTLSGSGTLLWHPDQRSSANAMAFKLHAQDAYLIQRREAQGAVSGDLSLKGNFEALAVEGVLNVSPLNINLNSSIKTSIPEINVTDSEADTSNAGKTIPDVHLNIKVLVDHQAYMRGRGLETEIGGEVLIKGTAKNPEVVGAFNTKRGKLDALGKTFMIQNGSVRLSNDVIGLRIPGVHTGKEHEYTVEIYGTSEAPKLRLSAVPDIPEDEILSRLIFGKSIQEITPFQAIRLASAVRTLKNGSSFDPLDKTRSVLGIDSLNIDNEQTDTGSNVNVGIGKYINERVYLELERSSDSSQSWKGSVQMEITPRVSVEAGTGDTGAGDAEIIWKKDY